LARRHRERGNTAFKRSNALLQHGLRRVHDARVDIPQFLEREQVCRVFGRIELVRSRLIDRHRYRCGRGIGTIVPTMQDDGFWIPALRRHVSPV
jgi:hypothetical protein